MSKNFFKHIPNEKFPLCTPFQKILKNKQRPLTAEKLILHDRHVSDNWVAFHRGQLEVHDLRLKAHLAKFVDRKDGVQTATDEGKLLFFSDFASECRKAWLNTYLKPI